MGAWGLGPFDNDGALEPISEVEHGNIAALSGALEAALAGRDYLEVDEGQAAIAAAEIVAAAAGSPYRSLPDRVARIVAAKGSEISALPEIALRARDAVNRVAAPRSELAELWDEGDDGALWRRSVNELRERLDAICGR